MFDFIGMNLTANNGKTKAELKWYLWIIIPIVLIVLDSQISIANTQLNLTVLFIYYVSFKTTPIKALSLSYLIGLILDAISLRLIGPNILSKVTVTILTISAKSGIFKWNPLFCSLLASVLTLVDGFIVYISLVVFDTQPSPVTKAVKFIIIQSLINAIIVILSVKHGNDEKLRK